MKPDAMKYGLLFGFCFLITTAIAQEVNNIGIDIKGFSKNYYSLPFIDLDRDSHRQVIVDKKKGQYLGHPTTVLLEDGKTMYCVYPKGHGRGGIVMKRSDDGGLSWSKRLPMPKSWETSREVPTLFPVEDAVGNKRVIMFSGLYPTRMAMSEDNCQNWSELEIVGDWGGIVVMGDLVPLRTGKGHYMAMFHDDERFFTKDGRTIDAVAKAGNNLPLFTLYKTFSYDGGLTWSYPQQVFQSRVIHLCEPGLIRSPDGREIAMLLRENSRRMNSQIMFSRDEGKTWTTPRQLPNSLTGDRHQAIYTPDGRLLISFRDNAPGTSRFRKLKNQCKNCDEKMLYEQAGPVSPTAGDWVAWVGTYEDLKEGKEGQYRIRLKDNTKGNDCAYPAIELLPDGTIVATTYGHWDEDEAPYIMSVRFKMEEIDSLQLVDIPKIEGTSGFPVFEIRDIPADTPKKGHGENAKKYCYRIPSLLVTDKGTTLAYAERRLGLHDHAQNDIVLKRSKDGGRNWGPEIVVHEDGMNSINDPLTVQLSDGRIMIMFARFPYGRHSRNSGWIKMAEPGYDDPTVNILTFTMFSEDEGLTWTKPVDITKSIKPSHWLNVNTPGAMIQLENGPHKGRIIASLWGTVPIKKDEKVERSWGIITAWSDDLGKTWQRSGPLEDPEIGFANECQIAEAVDGKLLIIARNQAGKPLRKKAFSEDGGENWTPTKTDPSLPSVACMGSLIKGPKKEDGSWELYASFPSKEDRINGQICISTDSGQSFQIKKIVSGKFAYSASQISADGKNFELLYEAEGYKYIRFLSIPLEELK